MKKLLDLLLPPEPYRLIFAVVVVLILLGGLFGMGYARGAASVQSKWDLAAAQDAARSSAAALVPAQITTPEVFTAYVDRTSKIVVSLPDLRNSVDRVCDRQATGAIGMLDTTQGAASGRGDAADRSDDLGTRDELAKELPACRRNTERLRAIDLGFTIQERIAAGKRAH